MATGEEVTWVEPTCHAAQNVLRVTRPINLFVRPVRTTTRDTVSRPDLTWSRSATGRCATGRVYARDVSGTPNRLAVGTGYTCLSSVLAVTRSSTQRLSSRFATSAPRCRS